MNAAPALQTATSKAARAATVEPIWSVQSWPPPQQSPATSSMCANSTSLTWTSACGRGGGMRSQKSKVLPGSSVVMMGVVFYLVARFSGLSYTVEEPADKLLEAGIVQRHDR